MKMIKDENEYVTPVATRPEEAFFDAVSGETREKKQIGQKNLKNGKQSAPFAATGKNGKQSAPFTATGKDGK